jgi:hypothetical protein
VYDSVDRKVDSIDSKNVNFESVLKITDDSKCKKDRNFLSRR